MKLSRDVSRKEKKEKKKLTRRDFCEERRKKIRISFDNEAECARKEKPQNWPRYRTQSRMWITEEGPSSSGPREKTDRRSLVSWDRGTMCTFHCNYSALTNSPFAPATNEKGLCFLGCSAYRVNLKGFSSLLMKTGFSHQRGRRTLRSSSPKENSLFPVNLNAGTVTRVLERSDRLDKNPICLLDGCCAWWWNAWNQLEYFRECSPVLFIVQEFM